MLQQWFVTAKPPKIILIFNMQKNIGYGNDD